MEGEELELIRGGEEVRSVLITGAAAGALRLQKVRHRIIGL